MKNFLLLSFVLLGYFSFAQTNSREQFPLFPECDASMANQQEACFYNTLQNYIFNNYKVADEENINPHCLHPFANQVIGKQYGC